MDLIEFPGEDVLVVGDLDNADVSKCIKTSQYSEQRNDDLSGLTRHDFSAAVVHLVEESPSDLLLCNIFNATKPGAQLAIFNVSNAEDTEFRLKTTGFTNVKTKQGPTGTHLLASKPKYEVGSSAKINLKKPAVAVWKIDDDLGEDEETIDPDNLLDDEDLKKPDPTSLRVCGTTGQRKACKDCSCGLADELASENTEKSAKDNPKSSCGNCYLGDAFRCASCPYVGMPAFKPGEKIHLSDNLLKADI